MGLTRWFGEKLAHTGIWLGLIAVRVLPPSFLFSLSEAIANVGFYLFRSFRRRSVGNISTALGDQLNRSQINGMVHQSLRNFLRDIVELGLALETLPEEIRAHIPLVGREHLETALRRGKGVIALSAHLGNFFLLGTRLAVEDYSTYVLVNRPRNGDSSRLLDHYTLKIGQKTIHARPSRKAILELVKVLRDNKLAVVIADEYRSGRGISVPFFGRTVLARRGPATLAMRTSAAVIPMVLVRDETRRLKLIIDPEIEIMRSGNPKADIRTNTLRFTQWLERTIRRYPDQWNWMTVRWEHPWNRPSAQERHHYEELTP
jgi:KDO2-lipid IV(A) lauroyltransferase